MATNWIYLQFHMVGGSALSYLRFQKEKHCFTVIQWMTSETTHTKNQGV